MTHSVPCPCCNEELYTTEKLGKIHNAKSSGPDLQQEADRIFMVCLHCENKIDFIGTSDLRISPVQPCKK